MTSVTRGRPADKHARRPGRPRRSTLAVVLAALVVGTATTPAGPATAAPDLAAARAQATALAEEVTEIELRAAVATEDYNAIAEELAEIVSRMLLATRTVDELESAESAQSNALTRRVSALYRSGGELSLYATVLDGGSPNEGLTRLRNVSSIVDADHQHLGSARDRVADAAAAKDELVELTASRRELERAAQDARTEVTGLLADRQQALATASDTVRRLADEERTNRRITAEAAAAQVAADAGIIGDAPAGNPYAANAIAAARSKLGIPYVWAATGPDSFDCSGLIMWAYRQAGLDVARTSRQQWHTGPKVEVADLRPGDLMFWARNTTDPATIHHVAMYVGDGQMIEAPHSGSQVRVVPIRLGHTYIGAARPGLP